MYKKNKSKCLWRPITLKQLDYRSGYFRGKKLFGDWDVRVEQAEFQDLVLTASSSKGAIVTIKEIGGSKLLR